jgi:hypothetical protein
MSTKVAVSSTFNYISIAPKMEVLLGIEPRLFRS